MIFQSLRLSSVIPRVTAKPRNALPLYLQHFSEFTLRFQAEFEMYGFHNNLHWKQSLFQFLPLFLLYFTRFPSSFVQDISESIFLPAAGTSISTMFFVIVRLKYVVIDVSVISESVSYLVHDSSFRNYLISIQ